MGRLKWVICTAIILGGCGFISGMFFDWLFGVNFIKYVSAVVAGVFGILLHGIPDEQDI
jgi:uncharacterized membrane protein